MGDLARTKLDIVVEEAFADVNALIDRIQNAGAQITQDLQKSMEFVSHIENQRLAVGQEVDELASKLQSTINTLHEAQRLKQESTFKATVEESSRSIYQKYQSDLYQVSHDVALKAIKQALDTTVLTNTHELQRATRHLNELTEMAEPRLTQAIKAVNISFWEKMGLFSGMATLVALLAGLILFLLLRNFGPETSKTDLARLETGQNLALVWNDLSLPTKRDLVTAFAKLTESELAALALKEKLEAQAELDALEAKRAVPDEVKAEGVEVKP